MFIQTVSTFPLILCAMNDVSFEFWSIGFESVDAPATDDTASLTRLIGSVANRDGVCDLDGAFDGFLDPGLECLEWRKSSNGISSDLSDWSINLSFRSWGITKIKLKKKTIYLGLGIRGLPSLDFGVVDRLLDESLDAVAGLVVLLVELYRNIFSVVLRDPTWLSIKLSHLSALRLAVICDRLKVPAGMLSLRSAANPGTRFIVVNNGLGVLPVRILLL